MQWRYDAASVPQPVNQFLFQNGVPTRGGAVEAEDVVIVLGWANSPVILPNAAGEPEVVGIENNTLPVTVVGQFLMTRERVAEFRDILTSWLESP